MWLSLKVVLKLQDQFIRGCFYTHTNTKTVPRSVFKTVLKGGRLGRLLSQRWQMCVPLSFLLTSEWKWQAAHICRYARRHVQENTHTYRRAHTYTHTVGPPPPPPPPPPCAPEPDSLDMGDIRERERHENRDQVFELDQYVAAKVHLWVTKWRCQNS